MKRFQNSIATVCIMGALICATVVMGCICGLQRNYLEMGMCVMAALVVGVLLVDCLRVPVSNLKPLARINACLTVCNQRKSVQDIQVYPEYVYLLGTNVRVKKSDISDAVCDGDFLVIRYGKHKEMRVLNGKAIQMQALAQWAGVK